MTAKAQTFMGYSMEKVEKFSLYEIEELDEEKAEEIDTELATTEMEFFILKDTYTDDIKHVSLAGKLVIKFIGINDKVDKEIEKFTRKVLELVGVHNGEIE